MLSLALAAGDVDDGLSGRTCSSVAFARTIVCGLPYNSRFVVRGGLDASGIKTENPGKCRGLVNAMSLFQAGMADSRHSLVRLRGSWPTA